jgi:hypothetical protein
LISLEGDISYILYLNEPVVVFIVFKERKS